MKNLISMTDFVLEQGKKPNTSDFRERFVVNVLNYANFLKQHLEIWMFVACYLRDGVWIPYTKDTLLNTIDLFNEWEQAKERCLFSGFEFSDFQDGFIYCKNKDLTIIFDTESNDVQITNNFEDGYVSIVEGLVKYDLQLTPTAIKQLGL